MSIANLEAVLLEIKGLKIVFEAKKDVIESSRSLFNHEQLIRGQKLALIKEVLDHLSEREVMIKNKLIQFYSIQNMPQKE